VPFQTDDGGPTSAAETTNQRFHPSGSDNRNRTAVRHRTPEPACSDPNVDGAHVDERLLLTLEELAHRFD
jgi:hypothetical protein